MFALSPIRTQFCMDYAGINALFASSLRLGLAFYFSETCFCSCRFKIDKPLNGRPRKDHNQMTQPVQATKRKRKPLQMRTWELTCYKMEY